MNLSQVKQKIADIDECRCDDEAAHCLEDNLYFDFVKHVSEVADGELKDAAIEVLKTKEIYFARWCA